MARHSESEPHRKRQSLRLRRLCLPLGAPLLVLSACDVEVLDESADAAEVGQLQQDLAGYGWASFGIPVQYWDVNDYQVPVCYLKNSANVGSDASYFAQLPQALSQVIDSAGLDFHFDGACSSISASALPSYITVVFVEVGNTGQGGFAAPGFGNRRASGDALTNMAGWTGTFQVGLPVVTGNIVHVATALHEFIHALGFPHEQQRPDSKATCAAALVNDGNNTKVPEAHLITPYDPESIMNYCRTIGGDALTTYDRLGLEIIYPTSPWQPIRGTHAWITPTGLITRDNGQLQSDFTARDGTNYFASFSWRKLSSGGGVPSIVGRSEMLPVSALAGSGPVNGSFVDILGRTIGLATSNVDVDNSHHTAIVAAVVL